MERRRSASEGGVSDGARAADAINVQIEPQNYTADDHVLEAGVERRGTGGQAACPHEPAKNQAQSVGVFGGPICVQHESAPLT